MSRCCIPSLPCRLRVRPAVPRGPSLVVLAVLMCLGGCYSCPPGHVHSHQWAQPVGDDADAKIYRITDTIYRGPAPKDREFDRLADMGIRTILSLQWLHDDSEEAQRVGLRFVRVPIKVWNIRDDQIAQIVQVMTDPENQPIYVHCTFGVDRTGLATAVYRVAVEDWSREEALCEMSRPEWGFWLWQNLVTYVQEMDVDQLRQAVHPAAHQLADDHNSTR